MNRGRLKELAAHIRANPDKFDMSTFRGAATGCGCIAYNAARLFLNPYFDGNVYDVMDQLQALLGITRDQYEQIYAPSSVHGAWWAHLVRDSNKFISAERAAAMLEWMVAQEDDNVIPDWSQV